MNLGELSRFAEGFEKETLWPAYAPFVERVKTNETLSIPHFFPYLIDVYAYEKRA